MFPMRVSILPSESSPILWPGRMYLVFKHTSLTDWNLCFALLERTCPELGAWGDLGQRQSQGCGRACVFIEVLGALAELFEVSFVMYLWKE